uniref:hypothetical protein n=1 Tax=Aeromicrobium sp. TaxID=1871063 RepID=UPI0028AF30C0
MRRRLALSALPVLLVASALVSSGASAAPAPSPAAAVDRSDAKEPPRVARGLIVKAASASAARRSSLA